MPEIVAIHAVFDNGGGFYSADVDIDWDGAIERAIYGVSPTDTAPLCVYLRGEIASGRVIPQPPLPGPPPAVPAEVTNFQARAVLMQMPGANPGPTLFDDVNAALQAMGGTGWQAWEYANTISRNGALVSQMAAAFGLDDAQLDDLFRQAATIEA